MGKADGIYNELVKDILVLELASRKLLFLVHSSNAQVNAITLLGDI
ncbi:hypothetical protein [Paenibacillus germinis]|nr:hypothetical protein [Paenibacillus germinis]